jgi:hypothetical protein
MQWKFGTPTARARQHRIDRRGASFKPPPNREHRLPVLPAIPDLGLLFIREKYPAAIGYDLHSILLKRLKCCGDRLRSPSDEHVV